MKIIKVIPSRHWRNTKTQATASIYGAAPYNSDADKANWVIEVSGYTWLNDNGTIGLGRMPAATLEEAVEIMDKYNQNNWSV